MKELIIKLLSLLLLMLQSNHFYAQTLTNVPAQFTFLYPLGTLYDSSSDYEVNFSMNIISGLNGAIDGFEWGGISNTTLFYVKGIQSAGIANVNRGRLHGIQVAGILNRSEHVDGIQIAGIYNRAKSLDGLQVGLINVVDTLIDGFSVGLINIYKRGAYQEWELSSADHAQFRLSYKRGSKNFYTIFTAGANTYQRKHYIMGIGFGHIRPISDSWFLQPEIIGLNYSDFSFSKSSVFSTTHFKLGLVKQIHERFALSISPSVYWAYCKSRDHFDFSPFDPIWKQRKNSSLFQVGYGLSIGIHFK